MHEIERFERFTYNIFKIFKHWHKIAANEMAKYGLGGAHVNYLLTLHRYAEGLTAANLCKLCCKDKADTSRALAKLIEHRLAEKNGANKNSYGAVFKLTEKGVDIAQSIKERINIAVEQAGKNLSEEKRAAFYEALEICANSLVDLSKSGISKSSGGE